MSNVTIYHYTDLNAFKSIIETGELWFTRIDCLNDYSEYNYYKTVYDLARDEFIAERNITHPYDLGFINKWIYDMLINSRDLYYQKTFTFSFSAQGDSIPMWNYYSDKSGIAIGFDRDLLIEKFLKEISEYYVITPCYIEYNRNLQKERIKSSLDEILKIINDPVLMRDDINKTIKVVNERLGIMWYESHIKNYKFQYEDEFRIVLCKLSTKKLHKDFDTIHNYYTKQYKTHNKNKDC